MKIKTLLLTMFGLICFLGEIYAQNFGPELLDHNDFGTVSSEGINTTIPLYPQLGSNPPDSVYYQPPTTAYYNNYSRNSTSPPPQNISINPYVVVAPPLTSVQTAYTFGFNETWYSNYYTFLNKDGSNSAKQIPMSPNNGLYVIATSTNGMYDAPTLGWGQTSWFKVYDRYETNPANPSNYFLIVNADPNQNKVFYKQKVAIQPGHVYRMSADLVNVSSGGDSPNVAFHIVPTDASSTDDPVINTGNLVYSTPVAQANGAWTSHSFDYIAPCDADYIWIAFTNNVAGGTGNDLGLDNLSLKELKPQIVASEVEGDCQSFTVGMTGGIAGAFDPANYDYAWYKENPLTQVGTGTEYTITEAGTYYLLVTPKGYTCGVTSDPVTIGDDPNNVGCLVIPTPRAHDNTIQAASGIEVSRNIIDNDCNIDIDDPTDPRCSQEFLQVVSFTIPAKYSPTNTDQTYVAGTPVIITDSVGLDLGLLKIAADGTLTFQAVPDYSGACKTVNFPYTIVNTDNGGQSTALIHITRTQVSYTAQSSCAGYPVTVIFDFPSFGNTDYTNNLTGEPILPNNPPGVDSVAYRYYLVNSSTKEIISDRQIGGENSPSFSIVRNDANNPDAGGTVTIIFTEMQAGLNDFQLRKKEPYLPPSIEVDDTLRTFSVLLCPRKAVWLGGVDSVWTNSANWASDGLGSGFPNWCTDVTILGDKGLINFPIIKKGTDMCKDIVFESGASVGKIQDLTYRSAFVQYQAPKFGEWTMITVPLKYIYSADFQPDMSWGANAFTEIKSYMSYFDMAYLENNQANPDGVTGTTTGSFSKAFADLKQKLNAGFGFASNVNLMNTAGTGIFTKDSTYYFPRFNIYGNAKEMIDFRVTLREVPYNYHYSDNGEWITSTEVPQYAPFNFIGQRGALRITDAAWETTHTQAIGLANDSRYRFIYEGAGYDPSSGTFTVTLPATGKTRIVGNPLMSHLDFDVFAGANAGVINNYYRIWDGTKFYAYALSGSSYSNTVWEGMDNLSTTSDDTTGPTLQYIPPMQAFFVDVINEGTANLTLTFNTDMSTAKASNSSDDYRLKAKPRSVNNNLLKLRLKMDGVETVSLLAPLANASDNYKPEEDIYKLFSYNNATPEIYTVSDKTAIEINAVSTDGERKLIPLGIKTNQTGQFEILVEGVGNFDAYPYLFLRDALNNKDYDLREDASFIFDKNSPENLEGRFYILMSTENTNLPTGIADKDADDEHAISIVYENEAIRVYSPVDLLDSFEVYDVAGRLLVKETGINNTTYLWNPSVEQGIYILKVHAGNYSKVQKINR